MAEMEILQAYLPALNDRSFYQVIQGGRGSGKSHFLMQKHIVRCATEKNSNFLLARKHSPAMIRSLWRLALNLLNKYHIEYRPLVVQRRIEIGSSSMTLIGLDDPDKIKSIEGINAGVWLEEALEFSENDFEGARAVLRGEVLSYPQMCMSYNPDRKNWLYKRFWEREEPNSFKLVTTYRDNVKFLGSEYADRIKSNDDERNKSWLDGQWAELGDLVFPHYRIQEFDPIEIVKKGKPFAGGDWGWNSPQTFVPMVEYDNVVYVLDELGVTRTQTEDFAMQIKTMLNGLGIKQIDAYFDSSEPTKVDAVKTTAAINAMGAKKCVQAQIDTVRARPLIIHPQCVETIKEISTWGWKVDRDGERLDVPVNGGDHYMDAIMYGEYGYFVTHGRGDLNSITFI